MLIRLPLRSVYSIRPAGLSDTFGKGKSGIVSRDQRVISGVRGEPLGAMGGLDALLADRPLRKKPALTEPNEAMRLLKGVPIGSGDDSRLPKLASAFAVRFVLALDKLAAASLLWIASA